MLPEVELQLEYKGVRYVNVERGLLAFADDLDKTTQQLLPISRKILRKYMEGVVESVGRRTRGAYPGGTSQAGAFPGSLSRRSGKLSSRFRRENVEDQGNASEVRAQFTISGIAAVHERGATIRPKRAQYLTIPLPAALSGSGVPLRPSARAWKNTFVAKSKKGSLLIFQKRGKEIVPLYALVKQVVIPKRLNFQEAFDAGLDLLADKIAQAVLKEFRSQ